MGCVGVDGHRGWDDLGVDPVEVRHPAPHLVGVDHVAVGAVCRSSVPAAEDGGEGTEGGGSQGTAALEVAVPLVEPAGRRVAVDDLPAFHVGAVGPAARRADGDLGVDRQAGEGRRQERQRQAMVGAQDADTVKGQGAHVVIGEFGEGGLGFVEGGEDRSARVDRGQGQHHPLGPAPLGQIVVDQGQRPPGAHHPVASTDGNGRRRADAAVVARTTPTVDAIFLLVPRDRLAAGRA